MTDLALHDPISQVCVGRSRNSVMVASFVHQDLLSPVKAFTGWESGERAEKGNLGWGQGGGQRCLFEIQVAACEDEHFPFLIGPSQWIAGNAPPPLELNSC